MDIDAYGWRLTRNGEIGLAVLYIWLRENLWKLCAKIAVWVRMSLVLGVRTVDRRCGRGHGKLVDDAEVLFGD